MLRIQLLCYFSLALASISLAAEPSLPDSQHQAFWKQAKKLQLSEYHISRAFTQATLNTEVLNKIQTPWEAKPWHQYHPIFLTDKRLQQGVEFWKTHAKTLAMASDQYGIPESIIVAILGVETFYGQYQGKYPVLDSLYSLAFHYPKEASRNRSAFFQREFAHFIHLMQQENLEFTQAQGSYAGAMGYGQFISSSYQHYAIDFDGDGQRNLFSNIQDAIGSIANYFHQHHWQPGEPVAILMPDTYLSKQSIDMASKDPKPKISLSDWYASGLSMRTSLMPEQMATLIPFVQPDHTEHLLAFHNFYVITRYNHSPLYARVVFELSQQLDEAIHSSVGL